GRNFLGRPLREQASARRIALFTPSFEAHSRLVHRERAPQAESGPSGHQLALLDASKMSPRRIFVSSSAQPIPPKLSFGAARAESVLSVLTLELYLGAREDELTVLVPFEENKRSLGGRRSAPDRGDETFVHGSPSPLRGRAQGSLG